MIKVQVRRIYNAQPYSGNDLSEYISDKSEVVGSWQEWTHIGVCDSCRSAAKSILKDLYGDLELTVDDFKEVSFEEELLIYEVVSPRVRRYWQFRFLEIKTPQDSPWKIGLNDD